MLRGDEIGLCLDLTYRKWSNIRTAGRQAACEGMISAVDAEIWNTMPRPGRTGCRVNKIRPEPRTETGNRTPGRERGKSNHFFDHSTGRLGPGSGGGNPIAPGIKLLNLDRICSRTERLRTERYGEGLSRQIGFEPVLARLGPGLRKPERLDAAPKVL